MMNLLRALSSWLTRYTTFVVVAVAVVAFFYPASFDWVQGDISKCILGVIMLAMGMTLSADDFTILMRRPLDIAVGAIAQYTIMPSLAFVLVYMFDLPTGIALGLILVGCCPGGVSSNIMSLLCKGDVAFSVGMTTVSTLLAPIMTPLLMLWLAGWNVDVDAWALFLDILLVTLLPVSIGACCNIYLGRKKAYKETVKIMPGLAVVGLMCIVGGVVAQNGEDFCKNGFWIFLTVFLHNALGYACGYVSAIFSHMGIAKRRTLSIEVGMQNAGLATVLAKTHFQSFPEAAVASAICCVWHSISGTILAGLFLKSGKKAEEGKQVG